MKRRSDIPYVQRQIAKKLAEQAAETARKAEDIARVERAAGDRALRFAEVLSRLTDEFEAMAAEDGQDVALARLARRVEQIMEG